MGWLIPLGETAVGLGLLFGALTGFAAFFGATMNMSFLLAGSASTNPVMFTLAVGVMLAWKVAGYYGLDRYLLPALGVPWQAQAECRAAATPPPPPTPPAGPSADRPAGPCRLPGRPGAATAGSARRCCRPGP